MSREPLTDAEIETALPAIPGWEVRDGKLVLRRELPTFLAALGFVQQVGVLAEEHDHHPDIDIRWRTVVLAVNTHDAGNRITAKDVELAGAINRL